MREQQAERKMPWDPKNLHARLAIWFALATGWFLLGLNSDRVPYGNDWFWVVACGAVAGAALGYVTRRTLASFSVYLILATSVGLVRSVAYLSNDSGGPAAVWFIVGMTNLLIYLSANLEGWGIRGR